MLASACSTKALKVPTRRSYSTATDKQKQLFGGMRSNLEFFRSRSAFSKKKLSYAEKVLIGHLQAPVSQIMQKARSNNPSMRLVPDRAIIDEPQTFVQLLLAKDNIKIALPTTLHLDSYSSLSGKVTKSEDSTKALELMKQMATHYQIPTYLENTGATHRVAMEEFALPGSLIVSTSPLISSVGGVAGMGLHTPSTRMAHALAPINSKEGTRVATVDIPLPMVANVFLTGATDGLTASDIAFSIVRSVHAWRNKEITHQQLILQVISENPIPTEMMSEVCSISGNMLNVPVVTPYNNVTADYLAANNQKEIVELCNEHRALLSDDEGYEYQMLFDVNLEKTTPAHAVFSPTLNPKLDATQLFPQETNVTTAIIGGASSGTYEGIASLMTMAKLLKAQGKKVNTKLYVVPSTLRTYSALEEDGVLSTLQAIGATILQPGQVSEIELGDFVVSTYNPSLIAEGKGVYANQHQVLKAAVAGHISSELSKNNTVSVQSTGKLFNDKQNQLISAQIAQLGSNDKPLEAILDYPNASETIPYMPILLTFSETDIVTWDKLFADIPDRDIGTKFNLDRLATHLFPNQMSMNVITRQTVPSHEAAAFYKQHNKSWCILANCLQFGRTLTGAKADHFAVSAKYMGCAAIFAHSFDLEFERALKSQGILPILVKSLKEFSRDSRVSLLEVPKHLSEASDIRTATVNFLGQTTNVLYTHTLNDDEAAWYKSGTLATYSDPAKHFVEEVIPEEGTIAHIPSDKFDMDQLGAK